MPGEDPPDDFPSEPPSGGPTENVRERESVRSRLESVIPDILKRAVEIGVEKARESPDNLKQFVHDLKLPKELAHVLFQQIDDTKNGLYRVVAKEIRDVLEQTNFSGEMQKLLTTVQFGINTTIRFTPNDGRAPRKDGADADESERAESDGVGGEPGDRGSDGASADGANRDRPSRHPLPKPEVKTSVKVRRDERVRDARRTKY